MVGEGPVRGAVWSYGSATKLYSPSQTRSISLHSVRSPVISTESCLGSWRKSIYVHEFSLKGPPLKLYEVIKELLTERWCLTAAQAHTAYV